MYLQSILISFVQKIIRYIILRYIVFYDNPS